MIKISPKIYTQTKIIGHEEIIKTKYKLNDGRKLIVKTVNANDKKELQIKKLFLKDRLLKSILIVFNKKGERTEVLRDIII